MWTQKDFLFASFFSLSLYILLCATPHIPYKVSSPKISSEEELALLNMSVNSSRKLRGLPAPSDMLKIRRQNNILEKNLKALKIHTLYYEERLTWNSECFAKTFQIQEAVMITR